jgi:hypothetical protein
MRWYYYFILGFSGLLLALAVAQYQSVPGYIDADYYYAGGVRLAEGHGFSEMVLWNYLDDPAGLPHPSHAYWMPLASILAAIGMGLTHTISLPAARTGFLLLATLIPPMTALLSLSMTHRRDLALTAGFLAVFGGYYVSFISTTDTFSIYMMLGLVFFFLVGTGMGNEKPRSRYLISAGLGIVAGLAHLTRVDGLLWLMMALLSVSMLPESSFKQRFVSIGLVVITYILVMSPWLVRNYMEFGTLLSPGGNRTLWLTRYDDTYSYPASQLTMRSWLDSGWKSILNVRVDALKWNLQTTWAVQGAIFLLPFTVIGIWMFRRDLRVQIGISAWLLTFTAMTVVFPFAGSRGGFLHSGAALQPLWWTLAAVGIDRSVIWVAVKRNWRKDEAVKIFLVGAIGISFMMSGLIFYGRVFSQPGWGYEASRYIQVESLLEESNVRKSDAVIVGNPPGYFNMTNRTAIAIPNENLNSVLELARRYNAHYLILENDGTPSTLLDVYKNPEKFTMIHFLGEIDGAKIFALP